MFKIPSTINAAMATLLFFVLVVIAGCTAGRIDLVKSGVLNIEQHAKGKVLDRGRSSGTFVSKRITGRSYQSFERFKVRFPSVPPQGSSVRVVSHSGQHDDATKSQLNNLAA